jgi:phosphoribosylaminoimidazole-succinocarboxamide synthase
MATEEYIKTRLDSVIKDSDLTGFGLKKLVGKVRDVYLSPQDDYVVLVATDRISAFDRVLGHVPCKGQVLSEISGWWFSKTKELVPNHVIATPDPNVVIGKKCTVFPIEFVVRGYISGTTSTSMWTNYSKGVRNYCGLVLPDGLIQNQQLKHAVVTPTTKEVEHDRLISPDEIVKEGWMTKEDYDVCAEYALKLFAFGQEVAAEHGLILADTKYEFGKDTNGNIMVVDEIHTPDSSRYWLSATYPERFASGLAPESIDKDVLRRWYSEKCDPYKDEVLPTAPPSLLSTVALRYIELYERITGELFKLDISENCPTDRIQTNVGAWISSQKY